MKRALMYLLYNGPYAALVVSGIVYNVEWAYNVAAFATVVFGLIGAVLLVSSDVSVCKIKESGKKIEPRTKTYQTLDAIFDILIISLFASSARWWIATFALIQFLGSQSVISKIRTETDAMIAHERNEREQLNDQEGE